MPVMLTRADFQRIINILRIFANGGCGGAHYDLTLDAKQLVELLETQLKYQ